MKIREYSPNDYKIYKEIISEMDGKDIAVYKIKKKL